MPHLLSISRLLITSILFIICQPGIAQKRQVYYNQAMKPCEPEKARYYAEIEKTDSGYLRKNYLLGNQKVKKQMVAMYEDSTCKILHGSAIWYYAEGNIQRKGNYVHNKPEGLLLQFHPNGMMKDSGFYKNGKYAGTCFSWHPNSYISDSIAPVNDSVFVHVSWFDDGTPSQAGKEINGRKTGTWVFYHHNGNKASVEKYDNGKCISMQFYDEAGAAVQVDSGKIQKAAMFRNGKDDFPYYIIANFHRPAGVHINGGGEVGLEVQFTVTEDGSVKDVYLRNPFDPLFDDVAIKVIAQSPKWKPAYQHNRAVKSSLTQKVSFQDR